MATLENYILGKWIIGDGEGQSLYHAVTGEKIGNATTKGLDFASMLHYARTKGNPALRKMTFHDRGLMLKALALHLQQHLPEFYRISYQTGATKADSWVDIEGGIGNLFSYASLRRKFPDEPFCLDGEYHSLGKENTFMGHHLLIPKEGVAVHINAFNFPVWGMLEKIAVNLLAYTVNTSFISISIFSMASVILAYLAGRGSSGITGTRILSVKGASDIKNALALANFSGSLLYKGKAIFPLATLQTSRKCSTICWPSILPHFAF